MAGETVDKQNIVGFNARYTLQVLGYFLTYLSYWPLSKTEHNTLPIAISVAVRNLKVHRNVLVGNDWIRALSNQLLEKNCIRYV
jgi:hypothetical protein